MDDPFSVVEIFRHVPDDIAEGIRGELGSTAAKERGQEERDPVLLSLKEMEQHWVEKVCEASTLNKKDLAKKLGVSRTTLWKRTRKG